MNPNKPFSLIVEDDEDLSVIFAEALKSAGFETEMVRNGRVAMGRLAEISPDVVILDLHLPEVAGTTILAYIRSETRLASTLVVVATADAVMGEQLRDTADFVLIKPISFGQLRDLTTRLNPNKPKN
jgi:two-component system, OmpR family, response regulator ResD